MRPRLARCLVVFLTATALPGFPSRAATAALLGWNDLGMHCMDADYSVFSILPPYNTIHAQFISQGQLQSNPTGVAVTYEAVPDSTGSVNRSSATKTDFWLHANALYLPIGAPALAPDLGLAGFAMPGTANTPQPMRIEASSGWFSAEGIPITPVDDAGRHNPYPMMRLVARNTTTGATLATANIVLPVSDEMDCRACHASGANPSAQPGAGWVWDCDAQRDYRRNILKVHDELNAGSARYIKALKEAGYETRGLSFSEPVLCARCHASNALPGTGVAGIPPLTAAVHGWHAFMSDPATGKPLDDTVNRAACYRCHPGSETRCLRGAMGSAIGADGSYAMQCQSCHGNLARVGDPNRRGWLDEPACQNCHTGTATKNSGAIRFDSAFDAQGNFRVAADPTFATNPDVPVAGASLYRFSRGHGGLYCSACHGATHAEFPSTEANDNAASLQLQGHVGMVSECTACHTSMPTGTSGGPHGLHPLGQSWISRHDNAAEANLDGCRACHGMDLRGTVLSRTLGDRTLSAFGTKSWWRGFQVGCYNCHRGPSNEGATSNHPAVVTNNTIATSTGQFVSTTLAASDADGNALTLRIVSQPAHGRVALADRTATYFPNPGFAGADAFTFAAWDGSTDSNLGTVSVNVVEGACALELTATGPSEVTAGSTVPFRATAAVSGCAQPVSYEWTWDDLAEPVAGGTACRTFSQPGVVRWQLKAVAGAATNTLTGAVTVLGASGGDVALSVSRAGNAVVIQWPAAASGYQLESAPGVSGAVWTAVSQVPDVVEGRYTVTVLASEAQQYFRLRKGP